MAPSRRKRVLKSSPPLPQASSSGQPASSPSSSLSFSIIHDATLFRLLFLHYPPPTTLTSQAITHLTTQLHQLHPLSRGFSETHVHNRITFLLQPSIPDSRVTCQALNVTPRELEPHILGTIVRARSHLIWAARRCMSNPDINIESQPRHKRARLATISPPHISRTSPTMKQPSPNHDHANLVENTSQMEDDEVVEVEVVPSNNKPFVRRSARQLERRSNPVIASMAVRERASADRLDSVSTTPPLMTREHDLRMATQAVSQDAPAVLDVAGVLEQDDPEESQKLRDLMKDFDSIWKKNHMR